MKKRAQQVEGSEAIEWIRLDWKAGVHPFAPFLSHKMGYDLSVHAVIKMNLDSQDQTVQ